MWRKEKGLSFLPPWEFQTPLSLGTPRLLINLPRKGLSQQESLRRNGVAIMVIKRVRNAVLGCNLKKRQNDLCSFQRQTIQYYGNPSPWPTSNAKEAEAEWFYENLQDLLRESFPRQVDKNSRGPQGERGLEFSRRKKGQTFLSLYIP